MKKFIFLIVVVPLFFQCKEPVEDISQWRGNNRDGIYHETNLLKEWPENGPEILWSMEELSMGNSSMTIANNSIYLTGSKDSLDEVIALDLDGNIKWRTSYGRTWNQSYPEARCTPTIDEKRLYVSSGLGDVACLDALSGCIIWKINANDKYQGKLNRWGIAESLIVFDDMVIFTPVGDKTTMIALNKLTGEEIWASQSIQDSTAYVSPILVHYAEKEIVINVTSSYILGVSTISYHH